MKRRWRWAIALMALALVGTPAAAGGKSRTKTTTTTSATSSSEDINPSSVVVTEDDFLALASTEPSQYDMTSTDVAVMPTGRGVVVAVLDAGFNTYHPAIAMNISPMSYDAVDGDADVDDFGNGFDDDGDGIVDRAVGHGTFVIGMVLDTAPDAMIVPIRVRDDEGRGKNEFLARGIEFATKAGVDVINLSLEASTSRRKQVIDAIKRAKSAGIVVVVSAGNDGVDDVSSLGVADTLIVGAVDARDCIAEFSNYSPGDLRDGYMVFAPGVDLLGPMGKDSLGYWSGTSFSAGIASGAAAMAIERHPGYLPGDVAAFLAKCTVPVCDAYGAVYQFGGRIDLTLVATR